MINSLNDNLENLQEKHAVLQQEYTDLQNTLKHCQMELDCKNHTIEHQCLHDTLTGLPNRTLLIERAKQSFQTAQRENVVCCCLVIGLDRFKEVNDALGQYVGDVLLQEVGRCFSIELRASDTLARLGGDKFSVMLPDTDLEQARFVVGKLQAALKKGFMLPGERHVQLECSVGIALFPEHGNDAMTVMQRADVAMYAAKKDKTDVELYAADMDVYSEQRLELVVDLKNAIENGGLELYYQPQVLLQQEGLPSFEALVRWHHPDRGMIFPDMFIPMAEETGLITPMTWWVLETAAKQSAAWRALGLDVSISVNLSAHNLEEIEIVDRVKACLKKYELAPDAIILEITESMLMDDPKKASDVLAEIDKMGVAVSIDDFGTGYSSLAYLKHLKVSELKIDRSFVMGMCQNEYDVVIVRAIISLAHNLGLKVVAEGVEVQEEWDLLQEMGCDVIQGYFISRPQAVDDVTQWLQEFVSKS